MRPSKDVNVNFVTGLTLIQEFKLINDTMWFLYKDKFIVDLAPMGQNKLGAKGRKTTTYRNVVIDSDSVLAELNKSKPSEDIVLLPNTTSNLTDSFWSKTGSSRLIRMSSIFIPCSTHWNETKSLTVIKPLRIF